MNYRNTLCEECGIPDDFELPAPTQTIHSAALAIETPAALQPDAELTAGLPLLGALFTHGEWVGTSRYCVPCDDTHDAELFPTHCPCGAAWDKPTPSQEPETP